MKILLSKIAYARSGDKGGSSNVGIIFINQDIYKWAKKNITTKLLKDYYKNVVLGDIKRYELDNINAFNFILNNSLGGGGSETLLNDAQGKTHAQLLLMMEVNLPKELYATI